MESISDLATAPVQTPAMAATTSATTTISAISRLYPDLVSQLPPEILYMVFDALVDDKHTITISTSANHHSVIEPLAQSCHKLRDLVKDWSKKRPALTSSPVFGLLNPLTTSFDVCFPEIAGAPGRGYSEWPSTSTIWRKFTPSVANEKLKKLELWQRHMDGIKKGNRMDVAMSMRNDSPMTKILVGKSVGEEEAHEDFDPINMLKCFMDLNGLLFRLKQKARDEKRSLEGK